MSGDICARWVECESTAAGSRFLISMSKAKSKKTAAKAVNFDRAVEVFVRAFAFVRSRTHPYLAEKIEGIWRLRDTPRTSGDYRNEEWVAHGVEPKEIDRIIRQNTLSKYAVCPILPSGENDQSFRTDFKALGYRLCATEPFMIHDLKRIPQCKSPATIERVTTQEMALRLSKVTRSRPMRPELLAPDAPRRQYVALMDDKLVGWVASIVVGDSTWCSNMYVMEEFRRLGIGKALLSRLLRDDRDSGATMGVLLASHVGAKLYPVVGYRQIGTLYIYTPRRR